MPSLAARLAASAATLLLLLLASSASAANFTCAAPATCQSGIIYAAPDATTYGELLSRFSTTLHDLLGANNLSATTPLTTAIAANTTVRIPFRCRCAGNNVGQSDHLPVYTVQPQDSLYAIALNVFGAFVTVQEIATANDITNTSLIKVKQKLWIPLPCSCDQVDGSDVMHFAHRVTGGDTISRIAAMYGVPESTLMKINGITDPNKNLQAGQILDVPQPAQARTSPGRTRKAPILLIVLIATGVPGLAAVATLLFFWSHRKRRRNRRDVIHGIPGEDVCFQGEEHPSAEEDEDEETSTSCQAYSYRILEAATCHFSNSNKLGSGGFGTVYRGTLENGKEVAVKRLKDSKRSLLELEREVSIVAKLRHENLVRFLGFCFEDEGRLLVYEYLPNNSLDKFLNTGYFQCQKLGWEAWFSIVKGIARGLRFLHRRGIIHRDLKPHNVLLDEGFNPKIADFDLVRVCGKDRTHESTEKVAGTFGYMAPECTSGRKFQLSIKSDVYSYGVLVLEIITGRKIHTFEGHNSEGLVEYVWQHWTEGKACDVVDSDLDVETAEQGQRQALRCVHVALLCVQSERSRRPTMDEVIAMISTHQDSELQAPSLPGYLHPKSAPGRVLPPLPCFGRN